MKVLHLISGGETGGSKNHVLTLLQGLNRHLTATAVCLLEGDFYRQGQALGLDIRLYPQTRRYNLEVLPRLQELIKEEGFQIIHCHGARANFLASMLRRSARIPAVTTVHSDYKRDFQGSFYKSLVYSFLNARALKSFDYYIAVSDEFRELLASRGFPSHRIFVVYNGLDFESPLDLGHREAFLATYGLDLPRESPLVGKMSRLHPIKGHEVFMEGARQVLEQRPDARFILAGEGDARPKLEQLRDELGLQERLFFLGYVDQPDRFINALDVNALTSHSESFPLTLLEGARQRKPTVSSEVGGIPRLVRHGETGFTFPPGDSAAFADRVLELLNHPDRARALGEALYQHARESFSLERLVEDHLRIYGEVLEAWSRAHPRP